MDNHHGIKLWKSGVKACEELCRYVDLASQIDITSTHPVSSLVQDWMGCLHHLLRNRKETALRNRV